MVGDKTSEGQAAGVYEAGPLARKGTKGGLRGTGNKVSSDNELTKVVSGVIRLEDVVTFFEDASQRMKIKVGSGVL